MCAARPLRRIAKEAALPMGAGVALVVGPVAVTTYDSRYWLPAVPVLCVASAIMMSGKRPGSGP
ncbi:hypothetical protein GCM10017673_15840 [Streptosporangium violaceochromogenes]|nr:hypothetical protein GCM10017673_15840 [Streptosporangium violaceochromogenes]